ncbi:MAG: hypothetical protein DBY45_03920 [Clostridiales bacterium]|nr:MAG: hypothetical protein DBY45_03920 [Clostridiales bacterium]
MVFAAQAIVLIMLALYKNADRGANFTAASGCSVFSGFLGGGKIYLFYSVRLAAGRPAHAINKMR